MKNMGFAQKKYQEKIKANYGFISLPASTLINIVYSHKQKLINDNDLRVAISLILKLDKIRAVKKLHGNRYKQQLKISIPGLSESTKLTQRQCVIALNKLIRLNIFLKENEEIKPNYFYVEGAQELGHALLSTRSPSHPVPVPSELVRWWKTSTVRNALTTMIYCVRGLSLKEETSEVCASGRVKRKSLGQAIGRGLSTISKIRAELLELGIILDDAEKDNPRFKPARIKHGLYFKINTSFRRSTCNEIRNAVSENKSTPVSGRGKRLLDYNNNKKTKYTSCELPNPWVDKEREALVLVFKKGFDSKATAQMQTQKPNSFGLLKSVPRGNAPIDGKFCVDESDFTNIYKLEELYIAACKKGIIKPSENMALNFVGASVHARTATNGDKVRIFCGIVRKGLWTHITQGDEDTAQSAINKFRNEKKRTGLFRYGQLGFEDLEYGYKQETREVEEWKKRQKENETTQKTIVKNQKPNFIPTPKAQTIAEKETVLGVGDILKNSTKFWEK